LCVINTTLSKNRNTRCLKLWKWLYS